MKAVYAIKSSDGFFKLGIAADVDGRLVALQTGNPKELSIYVAIDVECDGLSPVEMERRIHGALSDYRVRGEWFLVSPALLCETMNRVWAEMRYPKVMARWYRRFGLYSIPQKLRRRREGKA